MSINQVIIGALNPGENSYSIGSVDGLNFIACAIGTDVVVLASNFERIQVVVGNNHDEVVKSVNCCSDSGKISACYNKTVKILEPVLQKSKSVDIFCYRWVEVQSVEVNNLIDTVHWALDGLRLLVLSADDLLLYQHKTLSTAMNSNSTSNASSVKFTLSDDDIYWEVVWNIKLSARVKHVRFSPNGSLFATCGENDRFVKIWYQVKDTCSFQFIYIQHPVPVCGFEWRLSGRFMPRKYIQNAIITWCEDNTSRIWKEIPSRGTASNVLIEAAEVVAQEKHKKKRFSHKNFHLKKTKNRLATKFSNLINNKKNVRVLNNFSSTNASTFLRSATIADFAVTASTSTVVFALVATVNAENDCYFLPSLDQLNSSRKPFTVHWLNNKEILFTNGADKILAEALSNEQFGEHSRGISPSGAFISSASSSESCNQLTEANFSLTAASAPVLTQFDHSIHHNSDVVTAKDILDIKLESLLRQWSKSFDVLFSIHPIDGSLLTWTLEWLDDPWHQATLSFASRFSEAFPLTDAFSLNSTLSTFNPHDPIYAEILKKNCNDTSSISEYFINSDLTRKKINEHTQLNTILMLTSHENGSLNLWRLSMDERRSFSAVLNIVHESRMCGHRFYISQIVAHPSLPLLLTASKFNSKFDVDTASNSKETLTRTEEAELILWTTEPVAPLCKSGGLRELARITSSSPNAFICLSWIPAILPSYVLGAICNSPSSCFVASCNGRLVVYQALVDGRGLLSQLHLMRKKARPLSFDDKIELEQKENANFDRKLSEIFNIISTQSTAKPGCVLFIDDITDSEHVANNAIFFHIFDEDLASSDSNSTNSLNVNKFLSKNDFGDNLVFTDNYLVVMIVQTDVEDRIKMWSLKLNANKTSFLYNDKNEPSIKSDNNKTEMFYPITDPVGFSAAKLCVNSEKVYDERLDFGDGAKIISCVAAAGHLSSSSFYPSCRAPYTLLVSCSDDKICFLKCVFSLNADGTKKYEWQNWKMIDEDNSMLEMDGEIYSVSSAYSGLFSCISRSAGSAQPLDLDNYISIAKNLELSVFECESSGGVEWLREDNFNLGKIFAQSSSLKNFQQLANINSSHLDNLYSLIRIDWVSAEDGSHILTVCFGHLIAFFAKISQDTAQHNVIMMKENEGARNKRTTLRKSSSLVNTSHSSTRLFRWTCIRTLELQSTDDLLLLPTAISWVRDGLLIVGLNSEMRVYNQWNLCTNVSVQNANTNKDETLTNMSIAVPVRPKTLFDKNVVNNSGVLMNISRSHSMLDQLNRRPNDRKIKEILNRVISSSRINQDDEGVLEAVSEEGLFEAARLANPMLPQYHPKQLIEMLNAGKTKRVKAILLHVLRTLKMRQVSMPNPLSRAASVRKMIMNESVASGICKEASLDHSTQFNKRASVATLTPIENNNSDCGGLDMIPPLPLYTLFSVDNENMGYEKADNMNTKETSNYDSLFNEDESDEDLDEMLIGIQNGDNVSRRSVRSRHLSGDSEHFQNKGISKNFTIRHNQLLTDFLTHTHLPGLSSVDQMHLLAIADTISHFSSNVMDKLAHANALLQPDITSTLGNSKTMGLNTTIGIDTVDECGLRFLMAMKRHEYLLLCLPLKQRKLLKSRGISTAHIIWAFHSETEMELLNAIPCCQKSQETWDDLRAYGVAWWLKNTSTLRTYVEKIAKSAFQQNQEPMDASLFYLALKKKNVLTHLFKTVNDSRMYDFFREDFTQEKWKKSALKNAFGLMSKQRFHHAAAFFLLGGSLKDALQTILARLNDLQLAMVVLRLYETDIEKQSELMTELLCREVLGCSIENVLHVKSNKLFSDEINSSSFPNSSRDPFERTMAFWLIKEYAHAASTLIKEASKDTLFLSNLPMEHSLSDIFNFYSYLRRHPLVIRQRLTNSGIQLTSTEQFLTFAKYLEARVTPSERLLYFRTASTYIALGCPLLALDVLERLPKQISTFANDTFINQNILQKENVSVTTNKELVFEEVNWSEPTKVEESELELKWSDDEDDNVEENLNKKESTELLTNGLIEPNVNNTSLKSKTEDIFNTDEINDNNSLKSVDYISQHLKFISVLRIMMDELSTLASGFEIDGGQLRFELFNWLENECKVLHTICDFQPDDLYLLNNDSNKMLNLNEEENEMENVVKNGKLPLHELLRLDRINFKQNFENSICRRNWLIGHQKLLRTLISYCSLHSALNYRLTSIQMELHLLLLEIQRTSETSQLLTNASLSDIHPFPLLTSALSSCRMFVTSPLNFIQNQCYDILLTVAEFKDPPTMDLSLPKVYMLYNLCQGLSSCIYQSLSDIDHFHSTATSTASGVLTSRVHTHLPSLEDISIISLPSKWPGVENLISLLSREKDDDSPNLRLLLVECFVAITMSLFSYALTIYDSRWLFRLCAHQLDEESFGIMFGGGGQKKLVPSRPPPPNRPQISVSDNNTTAPQNIDSAAIRAKLNAKVFSTEKTITKNVKNFIENSVASTSKQTISIWVPPSKHIVQFYAEKVEKAKNFSCSFDSDIDDTDNESVDYGGLSKDEFHTDFDTQSISKEDPNAHPHDSPQSYAWILLRLVLVVYIRQRIFNFITLSGFNSIDISLISININNVLKVLTEWINRLEEQLDAYPGGCPDNFLNNNFVELSGISSTIQNTSLLQKYNVLIETHNSPFEYEAKGVEAVRRLWNFLVKQEQLSTYFIKHIFSSSDSNTVALSTAGATASHLTTNDGNGGTFRADSVLGIISEPMKIIQREHEPIIAFACNSARPGCIVVSTKHELQEISLEKVFEETDRQSGRYRSYLNNRVDLDIAMQSMQRDTLRDNDDYQLITPVDYHNGIGNPGQGNINGPNFSTNNWGVQRSAYINSFVIERSRVALQKLRKRQVSAIRRIEAHGTLPFYVSGSSDGSIYLWEWGVDQPLFTAREAGQYAKVQKLAFAQNSNKFAAVDGDGLLCIWQASTQSIARKPFFSQQCHSKCAMDVKFLGQTSSLLITAGQSAGEQNVVLWDTLMPQSKSIVHSFVGHHQDGATCVIYLSNYQSILSGGHHGEICIWDLRKCQLRSVFKAFDNGSVRCMCVDPNCDVFVAGSSEGDMKIWSTDTTPQLLHTLSCEHLARGGFSLRQVRSSSIQGVQQVFVDSNLRLFSCGADKSLKFRSLPSYFT